ncbi:exported protein of unknown function [Hyphomicrobium sp. MC1]|nr:exported protein of unknown function [Hyphomicrobium sp. MC1]
MFLENVAGGTASASLRAAGQAWGTTDMLSKI